mmetsp:Transcript_75417/g.125736  ORF Transcript_75417/g.125736 Transcript_75417/m.125736 type:complete len:247 (-) Transcript_75417:144-884(-)|eukprot:CAMPEP_0119331604 /NCGR_PEP_ID=MMETSP1333-20130426/80933_1 /TAXON_ID=418940 /ORGANISM="Scyphosphaera apsteinii, Strain RCC1455" /LENGTH=246 /DNA_ID=CAMNT_0007341247 /DNA_START=128 /DNA_END=868 /DNA_ORIENTATION=+
MRVPAKSPSRRTATSFIAAAVSLIAPLHDSGAFEVPGRIDQERLEQQLYTVPPPAVVPYQQQVNDAITIQSMRGLWQITETFITPRREVSGILTFRGAEFEERGTVTYSGDAESGRGPWIIKADGFGRAPIGKVGGAIERKGLFKLRRGLAGTFTYAGRITVLGYASDGLPDATIEGDIIQLINGGKTRGGREDKVGTFRAKLERRLTTAEEQAASDSAAAGGQPETLNVVSQPLPERVVQGQLYQ